MTDAFEGNGEYSNYDDGSSNFKRIADNKSDDEEEDNQPPAEKVTFLKELLSERVQIDRKYPHADRLLGQEINNVKQSGKGPLKDTRYVDIYREKPIKVNVKVLVPVKEHPKFNFVGKLLGPKGNSMKRLQEETMCKMAVLGRGSMKDRKKEEELRNSLEPKYAHLNDDLHVEISALAPPAEAHARVAYALAEVRKYLIPDNNDIIRREQMRELIADGTLPPEAGEDLERPPYIKRPSSGPSYHSPHKASASAPPRSPIYGRTVIPPKQRIISILDRARNAMEEFNPSLRHYDDPAYDTPSYEYGYTPPAPPPPSLRMRYEPEYESSEYRHEYFRSSPTYPSVKPSVSSAPRGAWKSASSSYQHHRSGEEHHESASKHHIHHSHRDAPPRYRSSPYGRPPK